MKKRLARGMSIEGSVDEDEVITWDMFNGVDLAAVRRGFKAIASLRNEAIENSMMNAVGRLLQDRFTSFKSSESLRAVLILMEQPLMYEMENQVFAMRMFRHIRSLSPKYQDMLTTWYWNAQLLIL
eukprot:TRINITY_DN593_c0_g1_i10.p2 TRINITY_DN593_c0_g1~~TRINITY_DN593_c0_g1_i10.p2  ORF type:complete len:126 (-),score=36.02 TRINITY_DN593_c0_g1_i10:94-471(-)